MRCPREDGFTLVETIVVTAIVAVVAGTLGTFFLAGTTPAVAAAGRDVAAAFDEARQTAVAFDAATVVFVPAGASGYRARVYARFPGDPAFAPRNGPTYEGTVAISETASPLGAPGFAFAIDGHGTVTAFANYVVGQSNATARQCPARGAFALRLAYASDVRVFMVPCRLPVSAGSPVALETPPPAATPAALPSATCPDTETCTLALLTPPAAATCPPGYTVDATQPGVCDVAAAPTAPPTCPPGYGGQPPDCVVAGNPTPAPTAPATAGCIPGAPDALGFATCLTANPVRNVGAAVTRQGCGTHIPIADPGPGFTVVLNVWLNGAPWGSYDVGLTELKSPWLDFADFPPAQTCGLLYTLTFHVGSIAPVSGNAATTPSQDTGDPAFAHAGVDAILFAPFGEVWGSNT